MREYKDNRDHTPKDQMMSSGKVIRKFARKSNISYLTRVLVLQSILLHLTAVEYTVLCVITWFVLSMFQVSLGVFLFHLIPALWGM